MVDDNSSGDECTTISPALRDDAGATILVCVSCRFPGQGDVSPRPGSLLCEAARAAADESGVAFRRVACLGNCKRGLSAAILSAGRWSYVFGGLDEDSADDLIAGARLLASSPDGFMPYGARPESLKRGLIARVPTLPNLEDLPK